MTTETTVSDIERTLLLDILRGRWPAGTRLPTVRELAASHAVNPATIQRVVARLETRGLVSARQGSGLRVNDPLSAGDAGLVPYWLVARRDDPKAAAKILADFLELRRIVAVRLLVRHRDEILARLPELGREAEALAAVDPGDLDALREADLAFARALLRATGNVPALAVFNTLASVLTELPEVARAMYARPKENVRAMADVLDALVRGGARLERTIDELVAEVDARTVARFARLLAKQGAPS